MKRIYLLLATFGLAMTATGAIAAPKAPIVPKAAPSGESGLEVSTFFSDHMVLQRGKTAPVWGWAPPGAKVTVKFAGQTQNAETAKDGRWTVKLASLTASAEGQTITITEGDSTLKIKDVLVGEVWLCSGQSNMAYTMSRAGYVDKSSCRKGRDKGKPKGIPEGFDPSKYPMIRQFRASAVKNPRLVDPVKLGKWSVCSEGTVGNFTAVGFFFAMKLTDELKVPIGLLNCSKGSTRVEGWGANGNMYRSQIKPLLPQAIRGAIWYQGEHNAGGPDGYGDKLKGLIDGWRKDFNQGDLPFYIVQLPNFCLTNPDPAGGDGWARIREEQLNVTKTTANTGIAIITDTGLIDNAHPDNKLDAGVRLALWALAKDYGRKDLVYSGPIFKEMKIEGDQAVLTFESVGSGFMVGKKEGMKPTQEIKAGTVGGFAIAGADKKWRWADAAIDGERIIVTCKNVEKPVAVRYAYTSNPVKANLYNRQGLPTGPFRTDTWAVPIETVRTLARPQTKDKRPKR
jgi:sialate O-acetylesterase